MTSSSLFTRAWMTGAGERAIKTFAQATLAVVSVGTAFSGVNWTVSGLTIAAATLGSLLTSVISPPATVEAPSAPAPVTDPGHFEGILPAPVDPPQFQAPPSV